MSGACTHAAARIHAPAKGNSTHADGIHLLKLRLEGEQFLQLAEHLHSLLGVQAAPQQRFELRPQPLAHTREDEAQPLDGRVCSRELLLQCVVRASHSH